jgi:hypothetical protein
VPFAFVKNFVQKWLVCLARTLCLWIGPFRTWNRDGARQMAKFAQCLFAKKLQTALILSVTFIWFHPWVDLNGLWFQYDCIYFSFPPPLSSVGDIYGKHFRGPFHSKNAPPNRCPPHFLMLLNTPL